MKDLRPISLLFADRRFIILILALLALNGCAAPQRTGPPPVSDPGIAPPAVEYKAVVGPAGALYGEAEKALKAGRLAEAEMLIERALRIEPRNPHYWHSLAGVKYRRGQYAETVQLCLKSDSLAGKHSPLNERNKNLLGEAKKALQSKQ